MQHNQQREPSKPRKFTASSRGSSTRSVIEWLSLINSSYLGRYDEEITQLKSQRRYGRPSSTREDLLKQFMTTEYQEYEGGLWIPNLQDEANLGMLRGWNGEWTALSTIKYVRLSRKGTLRESSFPPKGLS